VNGAPLEKKGVQYEIKYGSLQDVDPLTIMCMSHTSNGHIQQKQGCNCPQQPQYSKVELAKVLEKAPRSQRQSICTSSTAAQFEIAPIMFRCLMKDGAAVTHSSEAPPLLRSTWMHGLSMQRLRSIEPLMVQLSTYLI
jgi:hypothetical protein